MEEKLEKLKLFHTINTQNGLIDEVISMKEVVEKINEIIDFINNKDKDI